MQEAIVSKTRRKQEMHALQAIGVELLDLSDAQLDSMALPRELAAAVREAKRIPSREARRRQLQFIGRLMRDIDPEPIRARLAALRGSSAASAAKHRRIEQWRARLIEDDEALTQLAQELPALDIQALRALIRNARREQKEARPPRAFREIFRLLREAADATGDADA